MLRNNQGPKIYHEWAEVVGKQGKSQTNWTWKSVLNGNRFSKKTTQLHAKLKRTNQPRVDEKTSSTGERVAIESS